MKYFELINRTKAYQDFVFEFKNNKTTHCYLLNSEDVEFAKEFANAMAMNVICENNGKNGKYPCFECRSCKNIANGVHPDVKWFPTKNNSLSVEDFSRMVNDMNLKGVENNSKVYVIQNASEISVLMQNKLLKTLEEPPLNVIIILLCQNMSSMLATILSRVSKINIERFEVEDIYDFLIRNKQILAIGEQSENNFKKVILSPKDLIEKKSKSISNIEFDERAKVVAVCCEGLVGKAVSLMQDDKCYSMYNDMFTLIENYTTSAQTLNKVAILSKYQKDIKEALNFLQQILRDALMLRTQSDMVLAKHKLDKLISITKNYSTSALIGAIEAVNDAKRKLVTNGNVLAVIDSVLLEILEVRKKCQI